MSTTLEKEWVAVNNAEEIVERADTRDALLSKVDTEPCPECDAKTTDVDIVAVPKAHTSLFV